MICQPVRGHLVPRYIIPGHKFQKFAMTGFSLDSAAGNETLLLILDVYFAQAFVTGHCHLIRCSEIYHNFYQLSQSVKLAK